VQLEVGVELFPRYREVILFVKFVEFVAVFTDYLATNSTNWHELKLSS